MGRIGFMVCYSGKDLVGRQYSQIPGHGLALIQVLCMLSLKLARCSHYTMKHCLHL
jgi:hypothetical protein